MSNIFYALSRILLAVVCWIVFIFVLGALFSASAFARPFTDAECIGVGHAARQMAEFRDRKAPAADVEAAVVLQAKESRGQDTSYVRSDDDETFMRDMVARIYALPQLTPAELEKRMQDVCKHLSRNPREA